jgi:hypothetical protein
VDARLIKSTSQLRGLESNSAAAFYNERFCERARDRYVALLTTHTAALHPETAAAPGLVMTLASSPAGHAAGWSP